jgi:hypothetical protein
VAAKKKAAKKFKGVRRGALMRAPVALMGFQLLDLPLYFGGTPAPSCGTVRA